MKISDEILIAELLSGKPQSQIAKEYGLTKQQVCRRTNSPKVQKSLAEYRKATLDSVYHGLAAHAEKAVNKLVELLDDKNPFVVYNSSCKILNTLQDYSLQQDLYRDIEELKEAQRTEQQYL